MKTGLWIAAGIVACLLAAGGAYLLATGMMDSLYAFRSPLRADPPAPGEALGAPATRRVVFVLIDALRLDTALDASTMPTLDRLRREGAFARMHSRPPSYSEPGYSVLLTGAWPELSDGPAMNLDYADIPTWTQDNLFSAAHRAGLKSAVSAYYWFEKLIPQSAVDASFYTSGEDRAADREVVDAALPWLRGGDYQFFLIHIDQVDYAGHHEGGPRSPNWDAAATRADALLGEIAATLDLSRDTLLVASDHGQIERGGHGGNEAVTLVEPFVLVGAGVRPGDYGDVNMVDVAPTLAALLGTNLPAAAQGQARTGMLTLDAAAVQAVETAQAAQQARLLAAYSAAAAPVPPLAAGTGDVALSQAALEAARDARLRAERLPRFALALLLALLPAGLLFWRCSRLTAGWLAGGAIYLLAFYLRYTLVERLTFSLSWVTGASGLILNVGAGSLIALTLAWLVVMLGTGMLKRGAARAAASTLGLAAVILYLLALPVLWSFSWNGALVGWTLPEFTSWFLSLISLVQALMVGAGGLLLAGAAALAAALAARRQAEQAQATQATTE